MRAALYVRVSTDEQAMEGYSLDAQKAILHDYCISEDWEVVDVYEDDGFSGTNIKRPAYQRMIAEHEWDVILVLKMTGFTGTAAISCHDGKSTVTERIRSCMKALDTPMPWKVVVDMIQSLHSWKANRSRKDIHGYERKGRIHGEHGRPQHHFGIQPPLRICSGRRYADARGR